MTKKIKSLPEKKAKDGEREFLKKLAEITLAKTGKPYGISSNSKNQ